MATSPKMFKPDHKNVKFEKSFNGRADIEALYDLPSWRNHSKKFLTLNPNCYSCGNKSEATDHITPHHGDHKLFWKEDNLLPLCHRCHNTITSLFDRNHIKGSSIDPKLKWIARNRAINGINTKVKVISVSASVYIPTPL